MPLFFLGTREWRNRQTRTVQVRVPVMEWGFNSPLAHDETADPLRICGFCFPWLWLWCRRSCFLVLLVVPRVFRAPAVCLGRAAPWAAARPLAVRAASLRLGASARSPARPRHRPRAPQPGPPVPPAPFTPVGPGCAMGGGPPARRPRRFARWLVVGAGLAGAGYGLFVSVRWVAGLVETWKGRGMPTWPSWRER